MGTAVGAAVGMAVGTTVGTAVGVDVGAGCCKTSEQMSDRTTMKQTRGVEEKEVTICKKLEEVMVLVDAHKQGVLPQQLYWYRWIQISCCHCLPVIIRPPPPTIKNAGCIGKWRWWGADPLAI